MLLYKTLLIVISNNIKVNKNQNLHITEFQKFIYLSFPILIALMNLSTRGYLWTAHFQIFNILIPVLCLYHFAYVSRFNKIPLSILRLSLISGICLLAYPGSNIYVLAVTISLLYLKKFRLSLSFLLMSYLPTACWYFYIVERNEYLFSQSTSQWKQFVWITQALREGNLKEVAVSQFQNFYRSFDNPYVLIALFLLLVSFTTILVLNYRNLKILAERPDFGIGYILIGIYLIALYGVGTYAPRLNWPLIIVVVTFIWGFMVRLDLKSRISYARKQSKRSRPQEFFFGTIFVLPTLIWFLQFCLTIGPWS